MSIKILGGLARGFILSTPKTELTRPTSVLVRRKLFDWRQNLEGFIFIDLFAGSGAMGLEALSRGASQIYLNDSHRVAYQSLKQNTEKMLKSFDLDQSRVILSCMDGVKWLQREGNGPSLKQENVIIYIDPPYSEHALYLEVLNQLQGNGFVGEVWLEADRLKGPDKEKLSLPFKSVKKNVEQGDHFVLVGKLI